MKTLFYTAAHGGFDLDVVPLGGAAAIYSFLTQAWHKQNRFRLRTLTPAILGANAPKDKDLVRYSEMQYARFCRDFEKAATDEILRSDPAGAVVLSNDISESPDIRKLAEQGYPVYTLYHVDVVDYFARLYLRGWMSPERCAAWYDALERSPFGPAIPDVMKLVFLKQRNSLRYSRGVIVPSEGMKRVLRRCYPDVPADRIHVLPWGLPEPRIDEAVAARQSDVVRGRHGISRDAFVLLTLSRISPEKGQDRLLKALALWENSMDFPSREVCLLLCGEAAYMQGRRFQKRLAALAAKLKKVRVIFTGYLSGLEKQATLRLAQLYVFPSRHESYGLTLLEAFQAGLPALACHHYGAEETLRPEFGELLPPAREAEVPRLIYRALVRLAADPGRLKYKGEQARRFAEGYRFSDTADRLRALLEADLAVGPAKPVNKQIIEGRV